MTFLLDTNIVSEWVKARPEPRVVNWLADIDEDRVFLSVATPVDVRDVRMIERRQHLRFAAEAREAIRVVRDRRQQHLDRDVAV